MKSIKAKIIYYNIIKPTYDLIELFSINPGKSIKRSVFNSVSYYVHDSVWNSVWISVSNSVWTSVQNSVRNSVHSSVNELLLSCTINN